MVESLHRPTLSIPRVMDSTRKTVEKVRRIVNRDRLNYTKIKKRVLTPTTIYVYILSLSLCMFMEQVSVRDRML